MLYKLLETKGVTTKAFIISLLMGAIILTGSYFSQPPVFIYIEIALLTLSLLLFILSGLHQAEMDVTKAKNEHLKHKFTEE